MKQLAMTIALVLVAGTAVAETIVVGPSLYEVTEGVEFTLGNSGLSSFLFNWSDTSGSFSAVDDPTLILISGQTYTFRRVTSIHPFVITDDTLVVTGSHGSFARATTSGPVIDAATLTPIADFTADPSPTSDSIVWTPTAADVGTYYYTCRVTFHTGMTGQIMVKNPTVDDESTSWSEVKTLFRD